MMPTHLLKLSRNMGYSHPFLLQGVQSMDPKLDHIDSKLLLIPTLYFKGMFTFTHFRPHDDTTSPLDLSRSRTLPTTLLYMHLPHSKSERPL